MLRRKTHQTIAKITSDFEELHLNTSVAALMELFNQLSDFNADPATASAEDAFAVREAIESLVIMLTPFAPHVAEELWEGLGHSGGLLSEVPRWPVADPELARREELEIPIQVNGKLRGKIEVDATASREQIEEAAREQVQEWVLGKQLRKVIYVENKLINFVV